MMIGMVYLWWLCLCALLVNYVASSTLLNEFWNNVASLTLIYVLWLFHVITSLCEYYEGHDDLSYYVKSKHEFS